MAVPRASATANPVTKLVAGLISALENLFGVNTRYRPANPVGGLVWGMFRNLNNALGFTPVAGVPTVSTPDPVTGTVTGTWSFTQPAGLAMEYVYNDPSMGDVTVFYDGTFSYTPSQAARQIATLGTTDSFNVVATDAVAATVLTITVPVLPLAVTPGGTVTPIDAGTGIRSLAISPDGKRVYVLNGNTNGSGAVTVIDTATKKVTATIGVKLNPQDLAVSPDGRYVYVTDSTYSTNTTPGGGAVQVIDTATNSVATTITLSSASTAGVAVSPDGSTIYAVDTSYWGSCTDVCNNGSLKVISTADNSVGATITSYGFSPSFHNQTGLVFSPDGARLYVTGRLFTRQTDGSFTESSVVAVVNTADNAIAKTITVGGFNVATEGVAISPSGNRLYVVSNNPADTSSVISDTGSMVSVIDTATGVVTATIPIGLAGTFKDLAISPDGKTLYAASYFTNTVTVINTVTNKVTNTIRNIYGAGPIVTSPDGGTVYAGANGGGKVYAISV
ncbi:YVTN family beta-propeller protein [Mycolicibacterium sp. BK634]|uniref:YncE family protein n=1 Tax=Mycolicibacterium sp. BK634 TaxID=2587099 RepID=UPI001620106A|nr:YVTN family beta-propeller protein [Mycolicibacterium sp. BK634]